MPAQSDGCQTVYAFLVRRFPRIEAGVWQQRIVDGKVFWNDGRAVTLSCAYQPHGRLFYYREVEDEPNIPFREQIVYQNEHLIVAYKPHFLPVNPMGKYVRQSLVNRLVETTGLTTLAPLHRIDRETAGLVLISANPATRDVYHQLFREDGRIQKTYRALATFTEANRPLVGQQWQIENRMVEGEPWFRMTTEPGVVNARSKIRCLAVYETTALFELFPLTGKTHQLRLHMSDLGYPLVNDRLYPTLQTQSNDNFAAPLQLYACRLDFTDPVCGSERVFKIPASPATMPVLSVET